MKFYLYACLFLLSSSAMAEMERKKIEGILPAELLTVFELQDVSKIERLFLKKIEKKEDGVIYLNYFSNRDVTIGFNNKKVSYLHVKIPAKLQEKAVGFFDEAYDSLSSEKKTFLKKKMLEDLSHEKGRFILIDLPQKAMTLEFYGDEKKTLRSITLLPSRENLP